MNILLIHGVNTNEDANPNPYSYWITAITNGLQGAGYKGAINTTSVNYNKLFDNHSSNILVYGAAAAELLASAAWNAVTAPLTADMVTAPEQPGGGGLSDVRWSAGMVAQWVVESGLQSDCRDLLFKQIQAANPDVIFAHSLGTLLIYDLLANDPRGAALLANVKLVTFGCQIANTFVKARMWGGQVEMVNVNMWYDLYNPNDPVFTAPIDLPAPNFHQFNSTFGKGFPDISGHDPTQDADHPGYLDNQVTDANLWPALAGGTMASIIARNIRILKRTPTAPVAAAMLSLLAAPKPPPPSSLLHKKRKHTYRYHPPRADHPLLKSAPKAVKVVDPKSLPLRVDLRNFCLPIRDQGQEGACSGFATAAFRETSHAVASNGALLSQPLAPAYLYARTRIDDGTFPADSGASIADEFSALLNFGVCPESFLPYQANPNEAPTPQSDVAALPFRFSQPQQVSISSVALKSVLASNQTITIAFTVYESFENPDANGILTMPNTGTEKMLGGHGVLLCGYDDATSRWLIRNQWGTDWGAAGYCYMPYGYEALWMEAWSGPATV